VTGVTVVKEENQYLPARMVSAAGGQNKINSGSDGFRIGVEPQQPVRRAVRSWGVPLIRKPSNGSKFFCFSWMLLAAAHHQPNERMTRARSISPMMPMIDAEVVSSQVGEFVLLA